MTITIFGATGMVGVQLVKQALHLGHTVKAYGRNVFTAGFTEQDNLHLLQGALFDKAPVRHAVRGSNAVISALGGSFDGNDKSRSLGMKNIVEQMEKEGIKRIVAIGGMGVLNAPEGSLLMDRENYPLEYLPVSIEHFKAYNFLKSSTLDWTFVCPPDIVNADVTGLFYTAPDHLPEHNLNKINCGDLAMFMLNELQKNEYIKKRTGISN